MTELKTDFAQAQEEVQKLSARPSNDDLLALYAFYKQATIGDVEGKRPGFTDFRGRAKYDAWAKFQGTDADTAMRAYIDKVNALLDADS